MPREVDLRRVVVYDLSPQEKARLLELAEREGRSVSRLVADLIRAAMK